MTIIREMKIEDYESVLELWKRVEGLVISEADSRANIQRYLSRNPGLSYVCEQEDRIVGTVLCGHDGRRGFIYHVAVDPECRKQRLGNGLVQKSLDQLRIEAIDKCHIFVLDDNAVGNYFWSASGWMKRSGFHVYSIDV